MAVYSLGQIHSIRGLQLQIRFERMEYHVCGSEIIPAVDQPGELWQTSLAGLRSEQHFFPW